jgi:hypothetical protein
MSKNKRPLIDNSRYKDGANCKVRLNQAEQEIINQYRRIHNEAIEQGVNPKDVKHGWLKSDNSSLFFKNPDYDDGRISFEQLKNELIKDMQEHAPLYPKIKREKSKEGHLLVIDPADVHIGKLCSSFETGEDYDSDTAVQRVFEGVQGIINKSSGWDIDKILFIGGNDILHVDTPHKTTTSGTPQDVSGMWYDNFLKAKKLYVDVLIQLIGIADVHFTFNPSNHDYMSGFFLADVIQTWFKNNQHISFDCSIAHRKGYKYHGNLIGTTHGDGAKTNDLPLLMATEFPVWWASTKHRYVYTHHVHHKTSKDFAGVTVESLRSPSGTDSWHARNGYQHAPKAIEGFIHHKEHGQIARLTHLF